MSSETRADWLRSDDAVTVLARVRARRELDVLHADGIALEMQCLSDFPLHARERRFAEARADCEALAAASSPSDDRRQTR